MTDAFDKIFGVRKRGSRVARRPPLYRGGRLRDAEGLTRAEALHFLVHHPHGMAFARGRSEPLDVLADCLVEASNRNKRNEETNMNNIVKALSRVGEAEYVAMVTRYAKTIHPELSRERAFTKVFEADDAEGRAIRRAWLIAKQGAPLDPDEARAEGRRVVDDAVDDELDALARVERLAVEERRRNPALTKAQAFTKAYTDPANAALAQRERLANRPRA
jgi:hypothetical protein